MRIFQETEFGLFISEPGKASGGPLGSMTSEFSGQNALKEKQRQIQQLQSRLDELQHSLSESENRSASLQQLLAESETRFASLQQDASESRARSDTIILQLTRQLERSQLQLEEHRRPRTLWERLRHLFAPAPFDPSVM